mmetsp:Transcript_113081/g.178696  ORF Transcript_113081/g.178696 Transcript_113081/m.178696 type:complete len:1119 (-) Transcript_113081:174-3530(-)
MAALAGVAKEWFQSIAANPTAAAGTIGGAATGYVGFATMDYNKDNFITDNGNRFTRFQAARSNMIAQVGQYRMDIRGLANIPIVKAHVFMDTAQLFMCTSAALSCAGRVGMHGSAPPGYLCALYTGHIFIGAMYLTICLWLGIHSAMRAQCAMTSLLTRKVRLPIPPLWAIDQARCFASGYEKQKFWDILRFPFMPHPQNAPEIPAQSSDEDEDEKMGKGKKEKPFGRHGDIAAGDTFKSTGRTSVPSWIRDENAIDKGIASVPHHEPAFQGDVTLTGSEDPHESPDHFKLFMEAQKEWFPYETYHRVALLFGVCSFFHAVTYYCIATAMSELRGFWIAFSTPGLFMAAMYWLIQLDIFKAHGQQFLRGFEVFGVAAPYFASAACMCEFRFQYSTAQVALAWIFALGSWTCHLLFACRFFDLMTPDTLQHEMADEDGKSWWPKSFWVPLAFFDNLWSLTPPKRLKKGQHCLLHEAFNLERVKGGTKTCSLRRRRGGKSTAKPSRRALANNANEMKDRLKHIEERFSFVFNHCTMTKTTQADLNQLHGRMWAAKQQVVDLTGHAGDFASGSEGSDYASDREYLNAKRMSSRQHEEAMMETAEELNAIEDLLVDFEKSHDVADDQLAAEGMADHVAGTKEKQLDTTPYWIMRFAVGTHIAVCVMVILATCAEILLGTTAIVSPPGEPPWIRNQKMRSYEEGNYLHLSNEPLPDWYRLFVAAELPEDHHSAGEHHGGAGNSEAEHSADEHSEAGHSADEHSESGTADAHSDANGHTSDHGDTHSGHRRLHGVITSGALNELNAMLPSLNWLADELKKSSDAPWPTLRMASGVADLPTSIAEQSLNGHKTVAVPTGGFMTHSLKTLPVDWPPLFEPRHLACQLRASGTAITALTTRGFGALLHLKNTTSEEEQGKTIVADAFALAGIGGQGTLVGSSWVKSGLRLITHTGHVFHCRGHGPVDGAWPCEADSGMPPLPVSGSMALRAAASTEDGSGERTVALLFEDMPTTVLVFKFSIGANVWQPSGEVHLPPRVGHVGLHIANDVLMIVGADGSVHHRSLRDGVHPAFLPAPASTSAPREWHSACDSGQGIMRLALRQAGPAMWRPELIMAAGKPKVGLVNV